jgi:hypothetical protein
VPKEGIDEFHGRGVSPVEVVQQEDERLPTGEVFEQRPDCAMSAVTLLLKRYCVVGSDCPQGRKDVRELSSYVFVEPSQVF